MPLTIATPRLIAPLLLALMAGCTSVPTRAPVEDRKPPTRPQARAPAASPGQTGPATPSDAAQLGTAPGDASKPLPGAENAGKPGYYSVRPGDTLMRIALDNGQNWRDVVRWNSLDNPNLIEVGQVLRVIPPTADAGAVASRGVAAPKIETRPLDGKAAVPAAAAASVPGAAVASGAPAPAKGGAQRDGDEDVSWVWPSAGPVAGSFDEASNKGLDITGKAGDPVLAAADGRVMWAGPHRGYGNLVIVKHNGTYLTAYANNQALLVKEDQPVRRGQKIAEMGSSDAERVQLHFEIRRQGKPIDPARLLPSR